MKIVKSDNDSSEMNRGDGMATIIIKLVVE
jgi:hypothetical protein